MRFLFAKKRGSLIRRVRKSKAPDRVGIGIYGIMSSANYTINLLSWRRRGGKAPDRVGIGIYGIIAPAV